MAYKYLVGPLGWPCSGSIFIPGGSPIGFSVEDFPPNLSLPFVFGTNWVDLTPLIPGGANTVPPLDAQPLTQATYSAMLTAWAATGYNPSLRPLPPPPGSP